MPELETKAGRLHYRTVGEGPVVCLWHSWLSDGHVWDAQIEHLSKRHRVITIDGPCHGRSEILTRRFTLDECADAVVEILDRENVRGALLGGLSWGGMTMMRVALRAPRRVLGLALFGTTAEAEPPQNVLACRVFAETFQRVGLLPPLEWTTLRTMFGDTTLKTRRSVVLPELRKLRALDRRGIRSSTRAIVDDRRAILGELHRVSVPTLVAVGDEDRCLPPSRSRRIARAIPGARFEIVPRAGHLFPVEVPHQATRLLSDFAERVFQRPPLSDAG